MVFYKIWRQKNHMVSPCDAHLTRKYQSNINFKRTEGSGAVANFMMYAFKLLSSVTLVSGKAKSKMTLPRFWLDTILVMISVCKVYGSIDAPRRFSSTDIWKMILKLASKWYSWRIIKISSPATQMYRKTHWPVVIDIFLATSAVSSFFPFGVCRVGIFP